MQKLLKAILIVIFIGFAATMLGLIFSGQLILPQLLNLGIFQIHYYGMFIAAAVIFGYIWAVARSKQYNLSHEEADKIIFWLLCAGFIGARLYHVLTDWSFYRNNFVAIFEVWRGGLSIYGVLIGGVIGLFFCKKILNLKSTILNILDWLAPSLVLGQIIGRFGNLFNYELFGYPTNLPWKMFVPSAFRPGSFINANFFHPLFLYESLGNFLILLVLLKIEKRNLKPGSLFFSYVLMYNVLRFCLEFLRIDSPYLFNLRINAIASLILALLGAVFLVSKYGFAKSQNS